MHILILYGTTHNLTKKITSKIAESLDVEVDIKNVLELKSTDIIDKSEVVIFVSPTYGDAELQIDMERFLISTDLKLNGKKCAICETGNYDGNNFLFGASDIINHHLDKTGCSYLLPSLSLDTLPLVDWNRLEEWCALLNSSITNYIQTGEKV